MVWFFSGAFKEQPGVGPLCLLVSGQPQDTVVQAVSSVCGKGLAGTLMPEALRVC